MSWNAIESELSKDIMIKSSNTGPVAPECLPAEMSLTAFTTNTMLSHLQLHSREYEALKDINNIQ